MNSLILGQDYLRKVKIRRRALQVLFQARSYDDVVRESQEIMELALKGSLRVLGVEPPKVHDPAPYFNDVKRVLPVRWQRRLPALQRISRKLSEERSHAFYGDEASDRPASALFSVRDAKQAVEWADLSIALLDDLLKRRV